MDHTPLIKSLSSLMGLRESKTPVIEINIKSAPRRLIGQLVRQGFVPSYQQTPDDLKWLLENEGDCQPDLSIHIIDLLGVYRSNENKVIVYDILIKLCALRLKVDYECLKKIVMLHELSHALTHRGLDQDDRIWECFDAASTEAKEYFAQIYTYKYLEQEGDAQGLRIMDSLSQAQSAVYQTYKKSLQCYLAAINSELLIERRKLPEGCETYPIAGYAKWKICFSNLQRYREPFVGYWNPPTAPSPPGRLVTNGTECVITANCIKVRSYDYSPSGDSLPHVATCALYKILMDAEALIQRNVANKESFPLFSLTIDERTCHLKLSDCENVELWRSVVAIVGAYYPVLGKVLAQYEGEFT